MSNPAEEDYSKLPLDDRVVHKVWKVRLNAYNELSEIFNKSISEADPVFTPYLSNPKIFQKIIGDSNVVAQEAGVKTLGRFLDLAGPEAGNKLSTLVIPILVEKGLSSTRQGTKSAALEDILILIELLEDANPIIEQMTPYFKHRLPKLVAGDANAIYEIIKNYGSGRVVDPKLIIPHLPKLFAHADKKVRTEATNITVELYKWLQGGLETILFPDLKPVHQNELKAAFEKVANEKPQKTRLLRSEKQLATQASSNGEGYGGDDLSMSASNDNGASSNATQAIDPFDLMAEVEVLSKIPESLPANLKSAKWKERKEALEEIHPLFTKNPTKFKPQDDYSEFLKYMAKCMKDVNLQVVQLAAEICIALNDGLRNNFNKYIPILFSPVLERTKEKKPSVLDPLLKLLDTMFKYSSLGDVLEETVNVFQKCKIPKTKEEIFKFLSRCLCNLKNLPDQAEIEMIMKASTKGASDTQAPVRNLAQETIGTLMKVVGERPLNAYMESIDDIKMKKIKEYCEKAEVKPISTNKNSPISNGTSSNPPPASRSVRQQPAASQPSQRQASSTQNINGDSRSKLMKKPAARISFENDSIKSTILSPPSYSNIGNASNIPSKREASSPLKRAESTHKSMRGLTTMSIGNKSSILSSRLDNIQDSNNHNYNAATNSISHMNSEELEELQQLRSEKQSWLKQKQEAQNVVLELQEKLSKQQSLNESLQSELENLTVQFQQIVDESANYRMQLKSKETQFSRMKVDYDNTSSQLHDLQEKYKDLHNKTASKPNSRLSYGGASRFNNGNAPTRYSIKHDLGIVSSNDINSGVGRLSLDEKEIRGNGIANAINSQFTTKNTQSYHKIQPEPPSLNLDSDDWKRASQVTSDLKARIAKMKSRPKKLS